MLPLLAFQRRPSHASPGLQPHHRTGSLLVLVAASYLLPSYVSPSSPLLTYVIAAETQDCAVQSSPGARPPVQFATAISGTAPQVDPPRRRRSSSSRCCARRGGSSARPTTPETPPGPCYGRPTTTKGPCLKAPFERGLFVAVAADHRQYRVGGHPKPSAPAPRLPRAGTLRRLSCVSPALATPGSGPARACAVKCARWLYSPALGHLSAPSFTRRSRSRLAVPTTCSQKRASRTANLLVEAGLRNFIYPLPVLLRQRIPTADLRPRARLFPASIHPAGTPTTLYVSGLHRRLARAYTLSQHARAPHLQMPHRAIDACARDAPLSPQRAPPVARTRGASGPCADPPPLAPGIGSAARGVLGTDRPAGLFWGVQVSGSRGGVCAVGGVVMAGEVRWAWVWRNV